jgi:hypothetical protein
MRISDRPFSKFLKLIFVFCRLSGCLAAAAVRLKQGQSIGMRRERGGESETGFLFRVCVVNDFGKKTLKKISQNVKTDVVREDFR